MSLFNDHVAKVVDESKLGVTLHWFIQIVSFFLSSLESFGYTYFPRQTLSKRSSFSFFDSVSASPCLRS